MVNLCLTSTVAWRQNYTPSIYHSVAIFNRKVLTYVLLWCRIVIAFVVIPAKAREYVFTGVGLSVCLCVCFCDHDN